MGSPRPVPGWRLQGRGHSKPEHGGPRLTQEVAVRAVKQTSAVQNGEEDEEEEDAEFGEEDLFHQQVALHQDRGVQS